MTSKDFYPQAKVPEHLTPLTIERLPMDSPFYLTPGDIDEYEPPVVFVDAERRLKVSRSADIEPDQEFPPSPIGLVGIMKTVIIDRTTQTLREVYIADLRFLEDHQLTDGGEDHIDMDNQEEHMHWLTLMNDSLVIDGFIAPEQGEEIDEDIPKGILYGNVELHDSLKFLRKRSNKIMKKFMKLEAAGGSISSKSKVMEKEKAKDTDTTFSSN